MKRRRSSFLAVAALVATVGVGAGCSGGGSDSQYADKAPPAGPNAVTPVVNPNKHMPGAAGMVPGGGAVGGPVKK